MSSTRRRYSGCWARSREALESLPELRVWRGYAFTRASLGARLRDTGPLGGPDLGTVAVQLGRSAVPSRPSRWGPDAKGHIHGDRPAAAGRAPFS